MKRLLNVVLMPILAVSVILSGCQSKSATASSSTSSVGKDMIQVVDDTGDKVSVKKGVKRIGDGFPFHPELLTMLGADDKLVATITRAKTLPWLYKMNPKLNKAKTVFSAEDVVNSEELVKTKPDVVFIKGNGKDNKLRKEIMSAGIPVVQVSFKNFAQMKKSIKVTGKVLGSEGEKRANQYVQYFDSKCNYISGVTSKTPKTEKPKVLHIISLNPLIVDGTNCIVDEWIKTAGGVNAADIEGTAKTVSMEQILKWNPDIIITGKVHDNGFAPNVTAEKIFDDPQWKEIKAVKSKKVYDNPMGAFLWDRFGPEEVLQIQWAAKIFYPDKFESLNINDEAKKFYKKYFNYQLSDDEVKRILASEEPQ